MKRFRVLFLLLGFLLLGILIFRTDPQQIFSYLSMIGWRFLLIIGVAFGWQFGNTIAWGLAFQRGERVRFRHLFVAKLGGDAINYITPLLGLGGEFVKPYLIRRHVSLSASFASIVITKTVQAMTGVIYALVGIGCALFFLNLSPSVWATTAGVVGAGGAILLWLFIQQHRNPFSSLLKVLIRLGVKTGSLKDRLHSAAEMDAYIAAYYRKERMRLLAAVAIYCLSWTFGVLETWLIVHLLEAPISFGTAFFLTSLSSVISTAFFFVPGGVGVSEGGQVFLFGLLGLPPAMGLAVGIIKRIRKLVYVLAGLLLISGWLCKGEKEEAEGSGWGEGCRAVDTV